MKRVVITGTGIWSCLGTDLETVKDALYNGKSGIGLLPERLEYGYRSGLSGIVETPVITKQMLDRHTRAGMPEEAQYAYMASRQAFAQAQITDEYLRENEVGCIFGNDSTAKPVIESAKIMDEKHDSAMLGYGMIFQSMNSTVNMNLSTIFHLRGVNFTISAACASGSHSIGLGYMLIRQGLQEMVLCGGAQETNYYSMASFDALGAFSVRMDEPTKASRPFDKDRDGLIPSGGAAALVLEDYDHAVARGATILAEVVGYGFSSNGGGISEPSDNGSVIAMTRAMKDAGMELDDIDYINAHATSTPQGDMYEAMALDRMFRGQRALISSTKSMTGHECWMAGASEIVYSILMMQHNFVAPNINFENPDQYSEHLNLATKTVDMEVNTVLSNSFGFGGTNSALVISRNVECGMNNNLKEIYMKRMLMMAWMVMVAVVAANAKDDKVTLTAGDGKAIVKSEKTATLEFDYSNTIAEGKPLKEHLQTRGENFVKDWPELAKSARERFIERFNSKNKKGVQIVEGDKADLKMKITIEKLDFGNTGTAVVFGGFGSAGGAEITGKLVVTDAATGEQVATYDLHEIRSNGTYDFTEGKRLGTCYENVAKMIIKASK